MPEYLSPGVYIEEVNTGPRPIEGVGTATAAFVGFAPAGPVNKPVLITNWTQYVNTFGALEEGGARNPHLPGAFLSHAVYGADMYEIASREFKEIKEKLLFRLTNFGQPFIYVEDGNYNNRGELYLNHRHEGVDLKMDYARDTMRNIYRIWTRPVHLETTVDEKRRLITFDGSDFSERRID